MEPILRCPHCHDFFIMEQLNCGIFRHGIYKSTLQQMEPHLSKKECLRLVNNNEIIGCGKPFRVTIQKNTFQVDICDYI